jgi:hypothetical protein
LDLLNLFSPKTKSGSWGGVRRVESITITDKPLPFDGEGTNGLAELEKLDKFCEANGIRAHGYMGKSHCCIRQVLNELIWQKDDC